ncbi:MAG: class III extradiol dioxygenase family protein [Alphaproteobacteria bacterium]|nr:class III extradiol dioxygenase family protein [Alphaproteobacteria bacterium]
MARLAGAIMTSHVPAIAGALARGLQHEPYWEPFFNAFPPLRAWLARVAPDIVVVVYNDHGLNFFLDKMPTFAVGAALAYHHSDEGWGIPTVRSFRGAPELSWHIIEHLVAEEFDIVSCQEMLVDHAFTVPMTLCWPDQNWPVRTVPVVVNTVQAPLPSAARCYRLGHALGRAIASWPTDARVVVMGTGGLSHQLDGERAGFINKDFDLQFMDSMVSDPSWATRYSTVELVAQTGTQGVELLNWMVARGTLPEMVRQMHARYHIPISNTATGVMVLEPAR